MVLGTSGAGRATDVEGRSEGLHIVLNGQLERIARLPREQCEAIAKYGARTTWPAGFAVYERRMAANGVFIVLRGQIVLRNFVGSSRSFVPWVATSGETFGSEGLQDKACYSSSARAEEESETLHLSSARFSALLREQPAIALSLIRQLVAERTALLDKLGQHATLTVEQRLIVALLRIGESRGCTAAETGGGGAAGPIFVPRRLLGELVGATRESISLVLGRLAAEGLIERDGNGLVIADIGRLEERLHAPAHGAGVRLGDASAPNGNGAHASSGIMPVASASIRRSR